MLISNMYQSNIKYKNNVKTQPINFQGICTGRFSLEPEELKSVNMIKDLYRSILDDYSKMSLKNRSKFFESNAIIMPHKGQGLTLRDPEGQVDKSLQITKVFRNNKNLFLFKILDKKNSVILKYDVSDNGDVVAFFDDKYLCKFKENPIEEDNKVINEDILSKVIDEFGKIKKSSEHFASFHKHIKTRGVNTEVSKKVVGPLPSWEKSKSYKDVMLPLNWETSFKYFDLEMLVKNLDSLFQLPTQSKSPHLILETIKGRVFNGRLSMVDKDGTEISITKMKVSTKAKTILNNDEEYSYKITIKLPKKDGQIDSDRKVIVLDIRNDGEILDLMSNGVLKRNRLHRPTAIPKKDYIAKNPDADVIPKYLKECFEYKPDEKRKYVEIKTNTENQKISRLIEDIRSGNIDPNSTY